MGWALDNLGSVRCKSIAESLFEVEKEYGTKLHGFCPIHGDKKSASFFYNYERDVFGCQSCGAKGDLISLWCQCVGHDSNDIRAFRAEFDDESAEPRQFRPKTDKIDKSNWKQQRLPDVYIGDDVLQGLPIIPDDDLAALCSRRKWSRDVVERLELRRYTDVKGNHKIAIPIRDDAGRLRNIRLYTPGADRFKIISWFDQACPHCGGKLATADKKKQCKECGKAPNDYGQTRLFPAPAAWKQGTLWLCEGEPDTICALSMGLNAVTQTAGCGTWTDEFSQAMAGRDVVIAYDADLPGYKGGHKAAESIAKHAKSVRVLIWPSSMGVNE